MAHKRRTQDSGRSFEILPPDTLGLWKGDAEEPKSSEKRNRHRRRLRLFVGGLLVVLLAGLVVHIAWKASTPLPSVDDHNASTTKDQLPSSDTLSAALSFKNSQGSKDSEIRLAPAGEIPSSMYASTLDSVRVTLDEGKEADAELSRLVERGAKLLAAGEPVSGWPKLAEAIGDKRANKLKTTGGHAGVSGDDPDVAIDPGSSKKFRLKSSRSADHVFVRSASTSARSSAVTSGRRPNHNSKPRTAWCNSMPSPSAVFRPRAREAVSNGVSSGT